jgi:hypothetical protein
MHDEEWDILILIAVLFAIIIGFTVFIAYGMKGDYKAVNTLISKSLS